MSLLFPDVDWNLAASLGSKWVKPGPEASLDEIRALVTELKFCADRGVELVSQASELPISVKPKVLVVSRQNWIKHAASGVKSLAAEIQPDYQSVVTKKLAKRAYAVVVAGVFVMVSTHVLGQYDPFSSKFLLVAPNILMAERKLSLNSSDFRLWVCLHEQTHAVQFANAPWLKDYLIELAKMMLERPQGVKLGRSKSMPLLVNTLTSSRGRQAFDKASAVMGLLEGHADVMMDFAGQRTIPSVNSIRRVFNEAREKKKSILARQIGINAKLDQYKIGAEFCRKVIDEAGVTFLNKVFLTVKNMPTLAELHTPEEWIMRVSNE